VSPPTKILSSISLFPYFPNNTNERDVLGAEALIDFSPLPLKTIQKSINVEKKLVRSAANQRQPTRNRKETTDKQTFHFLLTDLDYQLSSKKGEGPIIHLYGRRKEQEVLVKITDFWPYFYVESTNETPFILQNDPTIQRWKLDKKKTILRKYFWGGEKIKLVKIFGKDPTKIQKVSRSLEKLGLKTYETDISYLKRFLLDNDIQTLNVLAVKTEKLRRKGSKIIAEAKYEDVRTIGEEELPSPELFYKLRLMSLKVIIGLTEEETITQVMGGKNRRIIAISSFWGTDLKPKKGALFLLREDSSEGEKQLLMDFLHFVQKIQPDILISYHGDSYDWSYLLSRMKKLNLSTQKLSLFGNEEPYFSRRLFCYRCKGRISFDLSMRTWGIHPPSGKKEFWDVVKEVLGKEKQPLSRALMTLWREGVEEGKKERLVELSKRALQEGKTIYELFWALGLSSWLTVLRVTGFPTAEASSCTERIMGEFELMRYMRRKGIIIPNRPTKEKVEQNQLIRQLNPHEGGTVFSPKGRLHTGVIITDFRSMYPSMMVANNIGGETLQQWVQATDYGNPQKLFHKQAQSCLALMEKTLIEKRIEKKKKVEQIKRKMTEAKTAKKRRVLKQLLGLYNREQKAMKIVANSMYGAHFYIRSRFYTQTLAQAIAESARNYLQNINRILMKATETIGSFELIYGDTDSAFIKMCEEEGRFLKIHTEKSEEQRKILMAELIDDVKQLVKKLNTYLPPPVELSLEDIAYRVIFKPARKKAYSYVSLFTDECKIKGFEAVRGDWSPLARVAQQKVLEILLRYPFKKSKRKEKRTPDRKKGLEFSIAKEFLITLGGKILKLEEEALLPKVVILSPIKKHPKQYKSKTPAVNAYLDFVRKEGLNPNTEWRKYDRFPWVINEGKGAISKRAKHPKYIKSIDRKYYLNEMFRACEELGVEVSLAEVQRRFREGTLEKIFEKQNTTTKNGKKTILPYRVGELNWKKTSATKNDHKRKKHLEKTEEQLALTAFVKDE
jgi:DNA polymerase I